MPVHLTVQGQVAHEQRAERTQSLFGSRRVAAHQMSVVIAGISDTLASPQWRR